MILLISQILFVLLFSGILMGIFIILFAINRAARTSQITLPTSYKFLIITTIMITTLCLVFTLTETISALFTDLSRL